MIVQDQPRLHLTYCLNVHPGETWAEHFAAVRDKAAAVRDRIAPDQPFGLGLRLGWTAAQTLRAPAEMEAFRDYLAQARLYPFTVNGFPYGAFHGGRVKEKVYQPDWRTTARRDYTLLLADLLAELLPEGAAGSISTVPCSYKPWIIRPADADRMVDMLTDCALHFAQIEERTGRVLRLGLEPEPGCYLETTAEALEFFGGRLLRRGRACVQRRRGGGAEAAEALLRRHLGLCLDACHLAVQFEEPLAALDACRQAGVAVVKFQLSAALEVHNERSRIEALHPFVEPVYLHQVRARTRHGAMRAWSDLPDALRVVKDSREYEVLRVHFHVPLYWPGAPLLGSTAAGLDPALFAALRRGPCEHLEIETYTFGVLPESMRPADLVDGIAGEYRWVLDRLAAAPPPTRDPPG